MRHTGLLQLFIFAIFICSGCMTDNAEDKNTDAILVDLPEWTYTKADSEIEALMPELVLGDKVAVLDENGIIIPYTVIECDKHTAVLENHEVELQEGQKYRVQYPLPLATDQPFMFYLYFGVASGEAATEGGGWLLSDWKKYKKDQVYHLKFNQPNGILLFDIIAPFDCEVDAIYLSSVSQKCVFCIKGAFNAVKDKVVPERTAWHSGFDLPQRGMIWEKEKRYKLITTVWPYEFSTDSYILHIFTVDGKGASARISIPDLKAGEVKMFDITEFDILDSPVNINDVIQIRGEEHYYDEVVSSF